MKEYYEFKVSLLGTSPKLWRKFQLPKSVTFQELHDAIQEACEWHNCHLAAFLFADPCNGVKKLECEPEGGPLDELESIAASDMKLKKYFQTNKQCQYIYDYGDQWMHKVACKTVLVKDNFCQRLIAGEGTFPPEDCGGLFGYEQCLDILSGKVRDEDNIKEWLEGWHPNSFNFSRIKQNFDR